MLASTRSVINYYWSWRHYIEAHFSSYTRFYNPVGLPKPAASIDSWVIFTMGEIDPKLFTRSKSQLYCVARDDDQDENMMGIVSDAIAVLDNPPTGKRSFILYDKATETGIGTIWIEQVLVRPKQIYSTGISSTLIDIYNRVKTARNAYA